MDLANAAATVQASDRDAFPSEARHALQQGFAFLALEAFAGLEQADCLRFHFTS
jgi:hypothetical protein